MAQAPGRLVIRTYAPFRGWLLAGGILVLGLLLLYVAFEWGRSRAGPERLEFQRTSEMLQARVAELEAVNRELRLKIATQETAQVGQAREREELARTIGELQAQVARQAGDLAFYRGIVGDPAQAPPVRFQQFRVSAMNIPGRYAMRLVLGSPLRPENVVSGTVAVTVEGEQDGEVRSLDLETLTGGEHKELRFSYRYLQIFELELALPPGFEAERTTVEARVARKDVEPIRQTFLWNVEAS